MRTQTIEGTTQLWTRCSSCRNRTGISGAGVTEDGAIVCSRCFSTRLVLKAPCGAAIEIVGIF